MRRVARDRLPILTTRRSPKNFQPKMAKATVKLVTASMNQNPRATIVLERPSRVLGGHLGVVHQGLDLDSELGRRLPAARHEFVSASQLLQHAGTRLQHTFGGRVDVTQPVHVRLAVVP